MTDESKIRWCDFHGGGLWADEDETGDLRVARYYFETSGTCGVDWYHVCPPCAAEQIHRNEEGRKWTHWTELGKMDNYGKVVEYFWTEESLELAEKADDNSYREPDLERMKVELKDYIK